MTGAAFWALLHGAGVTLFVSGCSIAAGIPLGLLAALVLWGRIPVAGQMVALFVSILRATPLVTLALFVYYALPSCGLSLESVPAALVVLTLNTMAFNCEIWRGALVDFPRDQMDAAAAFGLSRWQTLTRIVLPQVARTTLPTLVSEMTFLIKGSPAIGVVGIVDITRAAVRIGADTYEPLPPLMLATALYGAIVFALIQVQSWIERSAPIAPDVA